MGSKTLREILATDRVLRERVQRAAALAAYEVVKAAGIHITEVDISDAQADLKSLSGIAGQKGDETNAVVVGVAIGAVTGF